MHHTRKPLVRNGRLVLDPSGKAQPSAIELDAADGSAWRQWLAHNRAFACQGDAGHFTALREDRRGLAYWYGYRRLDGKLHKVYLGRAQDLLPARLEEAASALAGRAAAPASAASTPARLDWARLAPPVLPPRLVGRRRLTQRIHTALTFIYAPSGFGKSTLLNEWRQQVALPVAWLAVGEAENQPVRFWVRLVAALQAALGQEINLASYLQVAGEEELPGLLVQLDAQLGQVYGAAAAPRLALVLDDYHHIRNPKINALLQGWLDHWPPFLQLILAGHIKPLLAVGRLRAQGLVTELDADDLRFTVDEGVQFLQQHQPPGQSLAQAAMETLVQRTRGWPTGLHLAALALARQPDGQAFVESFSGAHSYLSEYFLENVLGRQSAEVQEFLLKTAILRQLDAGLCDAVTGRQDSAALLAWLWQENLFLMQLEPGGVYQYHSLFAEALQGELQRRMPGVVSALHRRAAAWRRSQHALEDAVHHLLAIHAWEEAATLIEELAVRELVEYGEDSRLLRWLRQLPAAVVQQHKTLLLLYMRLAGMGLSAGEVRRFLGEIEARIRSRTPNERSADENEVLAELEQMRGQAAAASPLRIAGSGRYAAAWDLLAQLDAAVRAAAHSPGEEEAARALVVYRAGLQENNLFVVLIAGSNCAANALLAGTLRRSRQLAEEVLHYARSRRSVLPETASIALHLLAWIAYERNQLEQSEQLLLQVQAVDPNPTSTNMLMSAAVLEARVYAARGLGAAAQARLQAARALHARHPSGLWSDQDLLACQAWCALRCGDAALAQALLAGGSSGPHALSDLLGAELLLGQGQPAAAAALLRGLLEQYPRSLPREPHIRTRILLALALGAQGEVYAARRLLAAVVRAAAPEGHVRPFADFGAPLAPLLDLVLQQETLGAEARHFVRQLLAPGGGGAPAGLRPAAETADAPLARTASVTPRELEVLHLLAAGCTNGEIAGRLTIAESTVKTHLANLYTKLRVRNRVEAVAWLQPRPPAA